MDIPKGEGEIRGWVRILQEEKVKYCEWVRISWEKVKYWTSVRIFQGEGGRDETLWMGSNILEWGRVRGRTC